MRYPLTALLLLPVLVSAQELHTFKNGEVADADKLNESLQCILNNSSGGCSATQQDNSVLIECADGTSGVIAGAGTVILYPEGQIGEGPPVTFPSGRFVLMDANDQVLGASTDVTGPVFRTDIYTTDGDEIDAKWVNLEDSQSVGLGPRSPWWIFYIEADCSGEPLVRDWTQLFYLSDLGFGVASSVIGNLLIRAHKTSGYYDDIGVWHNEGECEQGSSILTTARLLIPYTPAPEILNAAYPVRLEQLP